MSVEESDPLTNALGHVHAREVAVEGAQVNLKHLVWVVVNLGAITWQPTQTAAQARDGSEYQLKKAYCRDC